MKGIQENSDGETKIDREQLEKIDKERERNLKRIDDNVQKKLARMK